MYPQPPTLSCSRSHRKSRPSIFACNSSNRSGQIITLQRLNVLNLEGVDKEIVHSEEGDGVVCIESEGKRFDKVGAFLEHTLFGGVAGGFEFDAFLATFMRTWSEAISTSGV